MAAFKLVLPLTRSLAATLGFPRTRPTFDGEGLHPNVLGFKCFWKMHASLHGANARQGHKSYSGIADFVEFLSPRGEF